MGGYPIGMIILIVVSILIYFGLAQRILDRMRLTDRAALLVIAAIIIGSFITIPILRGRIDLSINVGGALVPVALAVYLLFKAGTGKEWIRAMVATVMTALIIFGINTYLFSADPWETGTDFLDPLYIYPIVAAAVAYLIGRSRRSAFVAATLGILSLDIIDYIRLSSGGVPGTIAIGGAGAFDAIVLAGIIAVILAEIVGESRERLQGGPKSKDRPEALLKGLDGINPEPARKPLDKGTKNRSKKEEGSDLDE